MDNLAFRIKNIFNRKFKGKHNYMFITRHKTYLTIRIEINHRIIIFNVFQEIEQLNNEELANFIIDKINQNL